LRTALYGFIQSGTVILSGDTETVDHIFVNRFRKWIGFLKHHPDSFAKRDQSFSVQASRIQENGNALILLVFHDITRIKTVEQIRKDFVANVSHELRTPLTALKGSTEVLLDGAYRNPEDAGSSWKSWTNNFEMFRIS